MTMAPKREAYDVVVIGAGPAGLAAAATSAEAGLSKPADADEVAATIERFQAVGFDQLVLILFNPPLALLLPAALNVKYCST